MPSKHSSLSQHQTFDISAYLSNEKQVELEELNLLNNRNKFIPKHLSGHQSDKGRKCAQKKNIFYQETTSQIINRNKQAYLHPVKDLEKIMRHFTYKFEDYPADRSRGLKNKKLRKERPKSIAEVEGEPLIERKIQKLLELPTLKRVNSEAKRIKTEMANKNNQKQQKKRSILKKFEKYFEGEMSLIQEKDKPLDKKDKRQRLAKINVPQKSNTRFKTVI